MNQDKNIIGFCSSFSILQEREIWVLIMRVNKFMQAYLIENKENMKGSMSEIDSLYEGYKKKNVIA